MEHLPEIRVTVENAKDEIPKLLRIVKPSWNPDQIDLKKLSGGMSCLMYSCFNKENPDDGVTVRARTNTFKDFPHVRGSAFEAKVLQTMNDEGLFPKVLATFQNGYCYTYIKGAPLYSYKQEGISLDDSKIRLMARKLAEIHSTKVEGCDYSKAIYFRNIYLLLEEKYPVNKLHEGAPIREDLQSHLKLVEEEAIQMDSPLVLCHGDPHPGNIVYDKETGVLTYVDWELAHVGYQAADVAYALQVFKIMGMNPAVKIDLPEDFDRKYIRCYLEKWFETQGKKGEVTDEDVDKLEKQANVFRLSCYLFWITIMMAQFTVAMPDHVDVDDLKNVMESTADAITTASEDDKSAEKIKLDPKASPTDLVLQMVNIMYKTFCRMKEEILPDSRQQI